MKISIKREQSQAGLSFAERKKFRPKVKRKRLLLLLVLLMTAATGAWAQDAKHLITATYFEQTRSLEQPLPYATTIGEFYEAVTGQSFSYLISGMSAMEMPLTGITSNNTSVVIGEFNGASTPVTVTADGKATVGLRFGNYVQGIFVTVTPPLYVTMADDTKDAAKWTASTDGTNFGALPIGGLKGDGSETVTLKYTGRLKVKGVKATSDAAPTGNIVDLSTLTADYEAQDGDVLTGVTSSYKVTIAAGATVTLDGVNISSDYSYCIKCLGEATIILKDGSTNTLTGTGDEYPALSIGDANTTLTIQGSTGVLNVTSGEFCAGIGGGYMNTNSTCGNIRIEGGVITAQGGSDGAGIGSDSGENCGDIIITGGTITAKGGSYAAGIGSAFGNGSPSVCGDITIANTVTKVTATKGENAAHSIGKGFGGQATCGTVTIGGTKYWENNAAVNGGDTYLAQSPLIYDPTAAAKPAATVTTAPTGAEIVGVGKTTALVSGGVADGGTLWYAVTTTNTKPTSTAGFSEAVPTAQSITASGKVYVWYYVKADDSHTDSEIAATPIEVPVADIIWDVTNVNDLDVGGIESYEKEGVRLSANAAEIYAWWYNSAAPELVGIEFEAYESGGYTFTAPDGKAFTKIEMKPQGPDGWEGANLGTGWAFNNSTVTWTGSAASTVDLLTGTDMFSGAATISCIAFYLSE